MRGAPRRTRPLRRRDVGRRRAHGPSRRLRGRGLAGPVPARPAAPGRRGLDDRCSRARAPRSGGRGPAGRARPDARTLPAVVRIRVDRRLRGHPLQRPVVRGLRALRQPRHGSHRRDADGSARPRLLAGKRGRPGPSRVGDGLRGRLRRGHLGDGARAPGTGREGLRDLAVRVVRRRRGGDAHARPGRCDAHGAAAVRRGGDDGQPSRAGRGRQRVPRGLPDGGRLRGRAGRRRRAAGHDDHAAHRARRHGSRRGRWRGLGQGPLPRSLPARLDARRRCACRDRRDGHVLVPPPPGVRRGQAGAREHTRPRRAAGARALPHLPRLRDRCLSVLHDRDPSGRRPRGAVACGQGRWRPTR